MRGTVIVESLEGAILPPLLGSAKTFHIPAPSATAEQPEVWTFATFDLPDGDAESVAGELSARLKPGPWYANFSTAAMVFVVFRHRAFGYAVGDVAGRADAQTYALAQGVPQNQIDWTE